MPGYSADFESSFEDDEPTDCSKAPEILHPYHWQVRFGVLWVEVLIRHECVRRVSTVGTRLSFGKMTTRLELGYSGCVLHIH